MKFVPIIIGHKKQCYYCGATLQTVILPQVDPARWRLCEDFEGTPEYIRLHDCPKRPKRA